MPLLLLLSLLLLLLYCKLHGPWLQLLWFA
jgi:hypothetical protein